MGYKGFGVGGVRRVGPQALACAISPCAGPSASGTLSETFKIPPVKKMFAVRTWGFPQTRGSLYGVPIPWVPKILMTLSTLYLGK